MILSNLLCSQAFQALIICGEFCACGQLCAWKAWSETSREVEAMGALCKPANMNEEVQPQVDVWGGEWHQNVTPQRSPAPACLVYGARALQSVSGTINRACTVPSAQCPARTVPSAQCPAHSAQHTGSVPSRRIRA